MNRNIVLLIVTALFFNVVSQNIRITGINKIFYYKTIDDFFNQKKDSIIGEDIVYDYGKVSYTDKRTNKKIKFRLHKDSSIFAFKIGEDKSSPIYAISKGEKRYGVYMGGNKNLSCIFYSRGNLYFVKYDQQNYMVAYSGTIDQFGYYVVFTKKDVISKKNGDIEHFIKDKEELYKKYINERADATTYYWNKNHILKQIEYLRAYND